MEIKENRVDREDKEEYYMGTRMAQPLLCESAIGNVMILVDCKRSTLGGEVGGAGWGLAHMPRTATPRRLRSRKRLQTNKPKPIKTKKRTTRKLSVSGGA